MRALGLDDLRSIVTDPAELAKGARLLDDGALTAFARHGDRLYADAGGAMATPYKVTVEVGARVAARCTCMAARTRPFCKHAAALLVAWSRMPEAFAEADRPPTGAPPGPGDRRRRTVKKGKSDVAALRADGVARVVTLVRELAATGVASVAAGRAASVRALGEVLRAGALRRLGGRVYRLADLLERAEAGGAVPAEDYADLVADLLLTARKIEKHLAGEPLDERHVEELIGKTWRKADRTPVTGLDLIEYAASTTVTPDGFVIRAQRFLDVATGTHYADKQIVPQFLARRTPPRPSLAGRRARGAAGSLYPGYAPRRLDLEDPGELVELDATALARVVEGALPGATAALAALQDHRRDVFAPDALPVAVRISHLAALGDTAAGTARLRAVDDAGQSLHLPDDPLVEEQVAGALRRAELRAILGELALEHALPVLVPRAVVVERDGRALALHRVTLADDLAAARTRGGAATTAAADAGDWAARARAAGATSAAVSVAEVRGEVAELLARGVASATPRAIEPLVARLGELGLERPAQVLTGVPGRPEAERLDDLVRVHQVLGLALIRVVGAVAVDRGALVAVPTYPSVLVPRPSRWLGLEEASRARAAGEIDRWSAAAHAARALADVPPAALLAGVHPWWAHAGISDAVAEAVARLPGAVDAARAVLAADRRAGRAARQTAIRILVAADPGGAPRHVAQVLGRAGDVALGAFALDQIDAERERRGDAEAAAHRRTRRAVALDLARTLALAGAAEDRRRAALMLGDSADDATGPLLRQAWLTDPSPDVREAAAIALGRRCDPDAIDSFVRALARRADDERAARAAALGLGQAGDIRGCVTLVDALAAGWRSPLLADCLRHAGAGVLAPLHAALAAQPALARRKAVKELLTELPAPGPS